MFSGKKLPSIPPLLVNDELITEFELRITCLTHISTDNALQPTMKAQFLRLCIVFHFFRSYLSTDQRFWPKYSSRTGWNFWKKCLNCVPPQYANRLLSSLKNTVSGNFPGVWSVCWLKTDQSLSEFSILLILEILF